MLIVVLVLLVLISPPALAAPWYVAYENALEALDAGDARGAIALLEEAVKERPEPGAALRTYGTRFGTSGSSASSRTGVPRPSIASRESCKVSAAFRGWREAPFQRADIREAIESALTLLE